MRNDRAMQGKRTVLDSMALIVAFELMAIPSLPGSRYRHRDNWADKVACLLERVSSVC